MSTLDTTGPTLDDDPQPPLPLEEDVHTHAGRSPWLALALLGLVQLMIVLDASITNVALPAVGEDLEMDASGLSWVVNAYILVFGGLLLLGGRMGDLLGRRLLFMVGLSVFTVASLLCGLATEPWHLIVARSLQGVGGAIIAPSVLAIIATLFAEGADRNKALGVLGAIAGSGGAIGVLLGGVLTDKLSWEWIFLVNVPVGLVGVLATPYLLDESRATNLVRRFDVFGAIAVTLGIASLVYALVDANDAGWGSLQTVGLLVASAVLLTAFVLIELRSKAPLVRLGIFRNANVAGANIVSIVVGAALFSMFFFMTIYLQPALGLTPLETGLRYLPLAGATIVSAGIASALVTRLGPRIPLLFGLGLTTLGLAWFTRMPPDGTWIEHVLGPEILAGLGLGFVFVPITIVAVTGVSHEENGLASGLLNTTQQVGGALGLAALLSIYEARKDDVTPLEINEAFGIRHQLADPAISGAMPPQQVAGMRAELATFVEGVTEGVQAAFWGGVAFAVVGIVLAVLLVRASRDDVIAGADATPPTS